MKEDLLKMGLTKNEVSVYLSLLDIGETAVGEIIKDLKFHRQVIYNALDSLENKNMVIKTIKNSVNHYKIADPEIILENIKKQELIAKRLGQNIKKEMRKSKREHEIDVYEGRTKIRNFHLKTYKRVAPGTTMYILSSQPDDFINLLGKEFFFNEYEKLRQKRKIKIKNLGIEANRKGYEENLIANRKNIGREARYLPDSHLGIINVGIYDDSVAFVNYGRESFMIVVKNEELRDSYKKHFDMLWKIAKK